MVLLLFSFASCRKENPEKPLTVPTTGKLEFKKIPDQNFQAAEKSIKLNLNDFLQAENIDGTKLVWSFSNAEYLIVKFLSNGKAEIKPKDPEWSGEETIVFKVSYRDSISASVGVNFILTRANVAPELHLPKSLSFSEDDELYPLDLSAYAFDSDNGFNELRFNFESENLSVEKIGKYLFVKTKKENWNGADTLTINVVDNGGETASGKIIVFVKPVNDKPEFTEIAPIVISEKEEFPKLDLKNYLKDPDNKPEDFSFKAFGGKYLQAAVDKNGVATILNPANRTGKDTITFAATDPGKLTAYCDVEFEIEPVNDPPEITKIPDQVIYEGETFSEINLNDFVYDPDDNAGTIKWKISGSGKIGFALSEENILTIDYPEDWTGKDTLLFVVQDKGGLTDSSFAVFTVEEKPLLKREPYKTVVNIGYTAVEDVVMMATQPVRWNLRDWATFGAVAGGTYLFTLVDEDVRKIAKRNDDLIGSDLLEFGQFYGETNTTYYAFGAFAAYGLVLQDKTAFRIGLEIYESYFIANTITSWLKAGIGRSRPYLDEGPKEYNPFNAKDNSQKSLPSGHATLAFSLSSVLAAHVDEWYWKALIFTPAVLTAAQRVIYDRHWFSDVFLGASIGYFVGTFLVNRHEGLMNTRFALYFDPYGRIGFTYLLK
ncbi:MAG: phosphatase PAP2 family protein [Chlorobi bacterium]|nr:phosphatase PAP2 family protein [Chlorobiota bacterium]